MFSKVFMFIKRFYNIFNSKKTLKTLPAFSKMLYYLRVWITKHSDADSEHRN